MLAMWHCNWDDKGDAMHLHHEGVYCLKAPHMTHMAVSGATTLVIIVFAAGMVGGVLCWMPTHLLHRCRESRADTDMQDGTFMVNCARIWHGFTPIL